MYIGRSLPIASHKAWPEQTMPGQQGGLVAFGERLVVMYNKNAVG